MTEPGPPPNATEIMQHVNDALQDLDLEPEETSDILSFAMREVPHLQTPELSYFVLGSYRDPYIRRVRIVQHELDKRFGSYPFLMSDLRDLDIDRLPTFRVKFYLIAAYADLIVAVFEQDAGGEITELGKISSTPYFDKSYVLPRDYSWMTDRRLESQSDVYVAAINVYFNEDLSREDAEEEIETLVESAQQSGIDVSREGVVEQVKERERAGREAISYSWVHLNEFRLFELHGQCLPWSTPEDLRSAVSDVP